ncbi:hypothetical protein MATL_G00224630 [Megalops atlanticus]|uniref:Uncharacterized protein n=1 Tax=Megalops atlanticus TaxID=7932 RepID=A0A9D3T2U9_MEGAT|nr:hypothetical protein MATL_G00224630 [Megalops atlanticus]
MAPSTHQRRATDCCRRGGLHRPDGAPNEQARAAVASGGQPPAQTLQTWGGQRHNCRCRGGALMATGSCSTEGKLHPASQIDSSKKNCFIMIGEGRVTCNLWTLDNAQDMIDTLMQQNRTFAQELEDQITRSQVMEEMLAKARDDMAEQARKIRDLKEQLCEKEDTLQMTEQQMAMVFNKFEASAQEKFRGLLALRSQVEELKQTLQESLQQLEVKGDEQRKNAEVESLRNELRMLKEENSRLLTLYTSTVDDNAFLKDSFTQIQTEINRLQGQLGLGRQMRVGSHPQLQPQRQDVRDPENQPSPEASSWVTVNPKESDLPSPRRQQGRQHRTDSTLQHKPGKVPSGPDRLEGPLPPQTFSYPPYSEGTIFSDSQPSPERNSARLLNPSKEYGALQRHLSEAQILTKEMDQYVQDCFQVRQEADSVTRGMIEYLVQQNRAFARELQEQRMRGQEMEDMLAEAHEYKAILMSNSQSAVEELRASIRTKDELIEELSGNYIALREENSCLQALYSSVVEENRRLKDFFSQSQTEIKRLRVEQDFQRQMLTDSQPQLQPIRTELQDQREIQPAPKAPTLVSTDRKKPGHPFMRLRQAKHQQHPAVQTGATATEEASTPEG